jgi:uncharacterized damage-inducible protein DinB
MLTEVIRSFYAYNHWANQRILTTAAAITLDQFLAPVGASFPSVRDTLVHTLSVQRNWLARFQQMPSPASLEFADFPDLESITRYCQVVEAETQTFIITLNDSRLAEIVHYLNSRGEPNAYPRWQMMLHQVNHATQHRSEVAVMLTQFGHSPGWLDFLVYVDESRK